MPSLLDYKLRVASRSFFDRSAVTEATTAETRFVLSKFGAFVRTRAKSLIRKARQKSLAEMTPEELLAYRIRAAQAKKAGHPQPKRPLASSKPGEPPRSVLGFLRKFLFFVYDKSTNSVVVGPAQFGGASGTAPSVLESGGSTVLFNGRRVTIRPRPYMRPSFESEKPNLPKFWAQAAAKFGQQQGAAA